MSEHACLPVRPQPTPGESIAGYLMRVASANGHLAECRPLGQVCIRQDRLQRWLAYGRLTDQKGMSVDVAARTLGVKQQVAYCLVRQGLLGSVDIGRFGRRVLPEHLKLFSEAYISLTELTYIDEYVDRLRRIRSERDIYEDLARWQEEQFPEYQRGAINGINTALGLSGPELLRADHLPTTAIGSLRGLVVVSANPGHHELFNLRENAARLSGGNGDFCRRLFQRYPECVSKRRGATDGVAFRPEKDGRTIRYWTYAMGLWSLAFGDAASLGLKGYERWKAAVDGQWALGGIDLVPFHSNRDGVTARLGRTEAAQLTKIAIETLKMVVALPAERRSGDSMHTRIVLVSSKHGAKLTAAPGEVPSCLHLYPKSSLPLKRSSRTDPKGL